MADNFDWFLARHQDVKVMIWAHNGHVETRPERAALGRYLRDRHGADYLSVGFVLGSGAYRALDARTVHPGRSRLKFATFTFGPPPKGMLDELLARTGYKIFAVDLRSARGAVRRRLEKPFRIRQGYGVVFGPDPLKTVKRSPRATHDLLIYIDPTTPARAISSASK